MRGNEFSQTKVRCLLKLLDAKQLLRQSEWKAVLREHDTKFSQNRRTVDSLRCKFAALHRKNIPSGDSIIPDDVYWARNIWYNMFERVDLGNGDDNLTE